MSPFQTIDQVGSDRMAGFGLEISPKLDLKEDDFKTYRDIPAFSEVFDEIENEDRRAEAAPSTSKPELKREAEDDKNEDFEAEPDSEPAFREDVLSPRDREVHDKSKLEKPEKDLEISETERLDVPKSSPHTSVDSALSSKENPKPLSTQTKNPAPQLLSSEEVLAASILEGGQHSNAKTLALGNESDIRAMKLAPSSPEETEVLGEVEGLENSGLGSNPNNKIKFDLEAASPLETDLSTDKVALAEDGKATEGKVVGLTLEKPVASPKNVEAIPNHLMADGKAKIEGLDAIKASNGGVGGEGSGFSENPSFLLSSALQGIEGGDAIQKGAASFKTALDAGLEMPDEQAILKQVSRQLRMWRPNQNEPIRFLLEPKQLGMIEIEITLEENGVTARMLTADPFVKELLEGQQNLLRENLKTQGLHVEQFSVDLGAQKGFSEERSPGWTPKVQPSITDADAAVVTDAPQRLRAERVSGDGRVNLYV